MDRLKPIILYEQNKLCESDQDYVNSLGLDYNIVLDHNIPPFLGLSPEGWCSYYVGATWLKQGSRPLVVLPKFPKIDFIRIFSDALKSGVTPQYFEEAYTINFDAPSIRESALNSVISPLIVSHFLCVVIRLLKRGLKRNYVIREDNLKCKVKGHVMVQQNIHKNVLHGHAEKMLCRYQEYSLNYPENRLLKRALLAAKSILMSVKCSDNELIHIIQNVLVPFQNISHDVTISEVKSLRKDKLHGEYPLAIKLAKQILQRSDFAITENESTSQFVPEFSVDMSRIFEFHVLSLLKTKFHNQEVLFQEYAGIMGRCDYLVPSEHLIIDAKYKENYPNRSSEVIRTDIREVAGYGRSERILSKLNIHDSSEPVCIIIYPNGKYGDEKLLKDKFLQLQSFPLKGVNNFYTLGVSIPMLE